jgi:hypothetical protein
MRFRLTTSDDSHFGNRRNTIVVPIAQMKKIFMVAMILVFLFLSTLGYFIWKSGSANAAIMARGAVEVIATVEGLDAVRTRSNSNSSNSITSTRDRYDYAANVSYTDEAGVEHVTRITISQAEYESWSKGQNLPLRYAVEDPSLVERRAGDLQSGSVIGYWLMIAGLVGCAVTFVVGLMSLRRKANVI